MTDSGLPSDLLRDLVALAEESSSGGGSSPAEGSPSGGGVTVPRAWRPVGDADFDALARRVFEHQLATNPTYRGFCEGRGVPVGDWPGWERVPAVPTRGFKDLDLISGEPEAVERTFRTSGTSAGRGRRGTHHVLSLDLYRRLSLPWFHANLVPDLEPDGRIPILSLVPRAAALPDSSLSAMVEFVLEAHGAEGSRSVADPRSGVDGEAAAAWLGGAEAERQPVLVLGTAFAFVHLLDHLADRGLRFALDPDSRAMETGGFKGRSREVPRDELYREIDRRIGVPADRIVNEYGMTELLSQFYEPVLRSPGAVRRHVSPPWMRTRIW